MTSRTQSTDAQGWTPFDAEPSTARVDADAVEDGRTSERPSERRVEGHRRGLRVIDGGQSSRSGFDAAADEALAAAADPAASTIAADPPPAPVEEAVPATVETPVQETAPATVEAPAQAPVEEPVETGSEADSTPHTPHPEPEALQTETPAETAPEEAETPHSTPWWQHAVGALNPSGVLFQPQASLAEIVHYADHAPYSASPAVRAIERGWNRAIAVPVSLTLYAAAAAYKRLWRGLGTSTIGVLWIIAVHAAPWDTQTVWTWTLLGYWTASALIVPAIVTKK